MRLMGEPDEPYITSEEQPYEDARERYLASGWMGVTEFEADLDRRLGLAREDEE